MPTATFGSKPSVLRCSRCGKFVDREEARLQVVCGCRPHVGLPPVDVRLYFYQRRGYRLTAVMSDAISLAGGQAGLPGFAGIPMRDEFHLAKERPRATETA
jgi:hypothetical protein